MRKFVLLAAALLAGCASEETGDSPRRSLKLLAIGNSFSVSLCSNLPQVAQDLGLDLDFCSIHIGGCTFERHWVNYSGVPSGQWKEPKKYFMTRFANGRVAASGPIDLKDALKLDRWDVISIQQQSWNSQSIETFRPWADDLVAAIRRDAPQAEIVVQETWSYTPWDNRLKKSGYDQNEMYERIHRTYAEFAGKYGFRVIPTGTAIQNWRKALPVRYTENSFGGDVLGGRGLKPGEMFVKDADGRWIPNPGRKVGDKVKGACDRFHLGDSGEFFQALVWTAKLFGADVTKGSYRPACVSEANAALMRKVAVDTVKGP